MRTKRSLVQTAVGGIGIAVTMVALSAVPASARTPITKAQARAIAAKINFRASDFPGYSVTPYKPSASEKAADAKYSKCVGAAPSFIETTSAEFDNPDGYGYSSGLSFVASVATVKQDERRIASAHARKCLEAELNDAAAEAGAPDTDVTLTPLHEAPVAGLDAIFGYKFTIAVKVVGQEVDLHGFLIGFGRGNAEVSLTEIGTADLPQSATNSALATLISRAKRQIPAEGFALKH